MGSRPKWAQIHNALWPCCEPSRGARRAARPKGRDLCRPPACVWRAPNASCNCWPHCPAGATLARAMNQTEGGARDQPPGGPDRPRLECRARRCALRWGAAVAWRADARRPPTAGPQLAPSQPSAGPRLALNWPTARSNRWAGGATNDYVGAPEQQPPARRKRAGPAGRLARARRARFTFASARRALWTHCGALPAAQSSLAARRAPIGANRKGRMGPAAGEMSGAFGSGRIIVTSGRRRARGGRARSALLAEGCLR